MLFLEGIPVYVVKGSVWGCQGKRVSSLTIASTAACEWWSSAWWSSGLAARDRTLRACSPPVAAHHTQQTGHQVVHTGRTSTCWGQALELP